MYQILAGFPDLSDLSTAAVHLVYLQVKEIKLHRESKKTTPNSCQYCVI